MSTSLFHDRAHASVLYTPCKRRSLYVYLMSGNANSTTDASIANLWQLLLYNSHFSDLIKQQANHLLQMSKQPGTVFC